MPEGHLVHRYAALQRPVVGQVVAVTSPQGRFTDGATEISGRRLDAVDAHGKHLLQRFGDRWIHTHLGMQGVWAELPSPPPPARPQARLRLESAVATWDLFAPSVCELLDEPAVGELLAALGPDPLRHEPSDRAWARLRVDDRPIGAVLLDQSVVAGPGNVFRSEVLAAVGIDPRRRSSTVDRPMFDRLWAELVSRMEAAAATGSIEKQVYKHDACARCGAPVESFDLPRGRTAYRCTGCQAVA